jgi:hypothetical protein
MSVGSVRIVGLVLLVLIPIFLGFCFWYFYPVIGQFVWGSMMGVGIDLGYICIIITKGSELDAK